MLGKAEKRPGAGGAILGFPTFQPPFALRSRLERLQQSLWASVGRAGNESFTLIFDEHLSSFMCQAGFRLVTGRDLVAEKRFRKKLGASLSLPSY